MSLTLIESRTQTTNFRFQRRDMANRTHGNATEFIRATASFRQLTCIFVGRTTLTTLLCGLDTGSVPISHGIDDAGRQEAEFEASAACGIATVENGHAHERDTS
ncbi:hypothetical protein ELI16_14510 [Rhizobium ruizarguesonis]|uniref:hypothetical protein n=1 Tax=Rhizobium ruizarguesonis TaxID=2081791 RepID=UPI00103016E8|nr:hypothetical protein [Rhizobium ruizarguesonis]TAW73064.1 hypothetical protein ELI16_14510 [Rhizobium ruizarguesonis]